MISLIIPVYNAENYIEKVLNSIFEQEFEDYEIVIVNDGSTDNSEKIIKEYMKSEKRINYIYQKNQGPGLARKNGFKNAKGELLFFVDSDDFLPEKKSLYEINKIFKENDVDILFFNFVRNVEGKEYIVNTFYDDKLEEGIHDISYIDNHRVGGALWNKIFRKKIMKEEFFIDANNFEDYYTTYSYLNKCNNFYYTKKVCYYTYRDNPDSLTKKNSTEKMIKAVKICKKINEMLKFKKMTTKLLLNNHYNCIKYILANEEEKNYSIYVKELKSMIEIKDYQIKYIGIKGLIKKIIIYNMSNKYSK